MTINTSALYSSVDKFMNLKKAASSLTSKAQEINFTVKKCLKATVSDYINKDNGGATDFQLG